MFCPFCPASLSRPESPCTLRFSSLSLSVSAFLSLSDLRSDRSIDRELRCLRCVAVIVAMSTLDELLDLSLEDKHIIAEYIWYVCPFWRSCLRFLFSSFLFCSASGIMAFLCMSCVFCCSVFFLLLRKELE
jgi:hypothetical protein